MEFVDEIKKIISLNRGEALYLTKEYLMVYLMSLFKDFNGGENRKTLIDKLKEYYKIIKEENNYMHFLLDNMESISSEEELNRILDDLDVLNERTYCHYDGILKEYEDNIFDGTLDRKIVPAKSFKTLIETNDFRDEVLGLTLSLEDLDEYFGNIDSFESLKREAKVLDVPLDEGYGFYGCYPQIDDGGKVSGIKICVPKIVDLKSMCINVHEFKHAVDVYEYLGQALPDEDYEKRANDEEEKFKVYLRKKNQNNL